MTTLAVQRFPLRNPVRLSLLSPGSLCLAEAVSTPTERLVETNGVQLRVTEAGERGAPVVVLAHGFPELAYSWRHQIGALADAGFHVLAPDQRGYGGSSKPEAIAEYNIELLCGDIVGLLDDIDAEKAAIVGHDWGALVAWNAPLFHPDRFAGVVGLSVPPVPRPPAPPIQMWRELFGENFFYIMYFQEPGVADADLSRDTATTMRRMLGGLTSSDDAVVLVDTPGPKGFVDRLPEVDALPDWISQDELDHYTEEFTRTGFTGGLNWYRNFVLNWELTANTAAATITVPALFVAGSADPVLGFTPRDRVRDLVSGDYLEVLVEGAGHWIQQERPDVVNEQLLSFLSGLELK